MSWLTRPTPHQALIASLLLLASCGGGEASTSTDAAPAPPAPSTTQSAEQPAAGAAPTAPECEGPAEELQIGSAVTAEVAGREQPPEERIYFCVAIPDGVSGIEFELTATTADLNLYVGHPELEVVQDGGLWFWASDQRGIADKTVIASPGPSGVMNPGPYYIEVSAEDFEDSSSFTLTVQTR